MATVARALIMLWNDSAKIVDPINYQLYDWSDWSKLVPDHDEPCIRAVRKRIRIPEVIALTKYDSMPVQTVTFSRRNLFKRDKMTCQYCGKQPGSEELTIDHVVPRAQGGQSTWTNCVLACIDCNSKKADRTPEQARMRLRKQPVRPEWKPVYAQRMHRVESWSKFISEAYWKVEPRGSVNIEGQLVLAAGIVQQPAPIQECSPGSGLGLQSRWTVFESPRPC